uniref:SPX domain-containing protein n=1 Tax=Oryza rufipogon TaxID=4529 RepID=A0A0E0NY12_ORYRU
MRKNQRRHLLKKRGGSISEKKSLFVAPTISHRNPSKKNFQPGRIRRGKRQCATPRDIPVTNIPLPPPSPHYLSPSSPPPLLHPPCNFHFPLDPTQFDPNFRFSCVNLLERSMKFGKSLSSQIVEMQPEWRDNFLSYKDLKKRLNLISGGAAGERASKRRRVGGATAVTVTAAAAGGMTLEQAGFVGLLDAELDKFNFFFLEKEEEYVIKQKELRERKMASAEEVMRVRKEIVDLHGEMVLLENYSALNYTGLVKILKKYDKRTGSMIRLPFIQKVLQQPFFTTDLLYKLVKECEEMLDQLMPTNEHSVASEDGKDDSEGEEKGSKPSSSSSAHGGAVPGEAEDERSTDMKSTVTAALRALREIRSGSSTVSVFSLPPLHGSNGQDEPGR